MIRECAECGNPLPDYVRADAIYCSATCRKRRERAKAKGIAVTGYTGRGYQAVTDNPPSTPLTSPLSVPSKYSEEELRIPDDLTIPKFLRREPDAPHWKLLDKDSQS